MDENKSVQHVAVVLDGNRRYARQKGLQPWKGHEAGAETLEKFLKWCKEKGIKETTLYVLSTENLNRDKKELDYLFDLFKKFFKKFKNNKEVHKDKVRIRFIGDLSLVPADIRHLAEEIEADTRSYDNYKLNFCFAYGGRRELVEAFNKLKNKSGKITENDITGALWLSSEPQLVIRTGDAVRTSNFLPWQAVYSEWIFLKKLWPEFTEEDFNACLEEFRSRKRNFGK